ncbi:MAG: peptidylprolyl isomerase [Bergeyella sp.]|nr:peptidylprolyl isomerase [Bergeyella sp.]
MAILSEIRRRPFLLMGIIALALLAFLINPDTLNKVFSKNPDILGKVNGEEITREDFDSQYQLLRQQAEHQGQPTTGLEEQTWQTLVQYKIIEQQFSKMGLKISDDLFWSQLRYEPMFSQNPSFFDSKGNFKVQSIKQMVSDWQKSGNTEGYNYWLSLRKSIEYGMMARLFLSNVSNGITTGKKESEILLKLKNRIANIDYVKIDYDNFLEKNPITVSTKDLADYIRNRPLNFRSEPSRSIGIVYFPALPSSRDEEKVKSEIEKLLNEGSDMSAEGENFRNTQHDSLYASLNSDVPVAPNYFTKEQLPQEIQSQISSAHAGQIFGPYKNQKYFVVSKLLDKKPSDSTLARHILISYKENSVGGEEKRTKEQAKKLADSIGDIIKTDPGRFSEFLKYSADKGSTQNRGAVGWTVSSHPQFVPEFQKFVDTSAKGSTGVVETQFGFHIINILDKKNGPMVYKVASLVKEIKPSEETEEKIDTQAIRFIQQIQGKTFNEYSNLAKKNAYNFSNPKSVKRFDGRIQGLGTDKDTDILAWAFDKKRKKGDTELFTSESTGDKIVVYLNGIYEEKLANPESVREQIEPLVKNQIAAKKIIAKLQSGKATSLDKIAAALGSSVENTQVSFFDPSIGGSAEPKVSGAAFGIDKGKISKPIEGVSGVYLIVKKSESQQKSKENLAQTAELISKQVAQIFGQKLMMSLQKNAEIKDYRAEIWHKVRPQQ